MKTFSIVTPTLNSEQFLQETIESVITQTGNFSIEYFIVDGGSSDRTLEIAHQFQQLISEKIYPIKCNKVEIHIFSGADNSMYDAITKGFQKATGDIYAWINSDDIYLPGAFNSINIVLTQYPEIEWIQGISSYNNCNSSIYHTDVLHLYAQELIQKGVYGRELFYIQQDSVFWQSALWKKVPKFDPALRLAGDYYLWNKFSEHTPLVSLNIQISCFRRVEGQLSSDMVKYRNEMNMICPSSLTKFEKVATRFLLHKQIRHFPRICSLVYNILFGKYKYRAVVLSPLDEFQLHEGDLYTVHSAANPKQSLINILKKSKRIIQST